MSFDPNVSAAQKPKSSPFKTVVLMMASVTAIIYYIAYVWYPNKFPVSTVNYRFEATVEIDGKLYTGSGVQQLTVSTVPLRFAGTARIAFQVSGDAVAINIPQKNNVYVLLASPNEWSVYGNGNQGNYAFLVAKACNLKKGELSIPDYVRSIAELSGTCTILPSILPVFVMFKDEAAPGSVYRVFSEETGSKVHENIRLVEAKITFTDDPVTRNIDTKLSWLKGMGNRSLSSYPLGEGNKVAGIIYRTQFRR